MAEQERKTKAERRAEARAERKRAEEAAAKAAKQARLRNAVLTVVVVGVIVAVVGVAVLPNLGGDAEAGTTISLEGALEARESAGCTMDVENQPLPDSTHHDSTSAPPADVLYADATVRPTHSGPHFAQQNAIISGVPNAPLDERALTHNLEHGSVIVYFDPDEVDGGTVDQMQDWMVARQDAGFTGAGGASIFVTPYENFQGVSADKPFAVRAWGFALDCETWDQDAVDSFVIDYWGTHGNAPERNFSPYPTEALGYEDQAVEDTTDAPIENESTEPDGSAPSDAGSNVEDVPTEPASDPASEG